MKEATKVVNQSSKVALAITGGISVYKIAEVVRALKKVQIDVQIVATESALNFVGKATWSALSGNTVISSIWDETENVSHVNLAKTSELVVIAPATADTLSDLVQGKANSAVTALALTTRAPIMVFPAMHTQMWEHAGTRQNIKTLIDRGIQVIGPESGLLTSGDEGIGRLVDPNDIAKIIINFFKKEDKPKILITSGGTKEFLDPVRYLTNMSSGKQGLALAHQAIVRGWETTLISTEATSGNWNLIKVSSAEDMNNAVLNEVKKNDIVIMAAAVSDWTFKDKYDQKLKKGEPSLTLELTATKDILASLGQNASKNQAIVGFAAETVNSESDLVSLAKEKLICKNVDLICANDVADGKVFNSDQTKIYLIDRQSVTDLGACSKLAAADAILNKSFEIWQSKQ
jgi:phosphopantothenoylcysteine decarboxylase / phosphopantothenate---cysteine ligase